VEPAEAVAVTEQTGTATGPVRALSSPPDAQLYLFGCVVPPVTTLPRTRARELREAAGSDADVVDPDEVIQLLRYPERAVQRDAAAALLGIVTEFPDAGSNAVDRLAHLLSTLEEAAPADECEDDRAAFGETLLLCLARVATYDPDRVLTVRKSVLARLDADGEYASTASVCLVQLLDTDPAAFVPHVDRLAALLDAEAVPARRHAAHALSALAESHPAAVVPATDVLRRRLDDPDVETVQKATSTLGLVARSDADAVEPILPDVLVLLEHDEREVRANAAGVVADVAVDRPIAVSGHLPTLCDCLDDEAVPVRRNVATAFVRVAAAEGVLPGPAEGGLIELLDDHDATVRGLTCRALGHTASPAPLELLRSTAQRDDDPAVREAARWAIRRIVE
jgi:hypothetical protein